MALKKIEYNPKHPTSKGCVLWYKVGTERCLACEYHRCHTEVTGKKCKKFFVFCSCPPKSKKKGV